MKTEFAVGDRVIHLPGHLDYNVSRRRYIAVGVENCSTTGVRYRVRCERDGHERVVSEQQMMPNPTASGWS